MNPVTHPMNPPWSFLNDPGLANPSKCREENFTVIEDPTPSAPPNSLEEPIQEEVFRMEE